MNVSSLFTACNCKSLTHQLHSELQRSSCRVWQFLFTLYEVHVNQTSIRLLHQVWIYFRYWGKHASMDHSKLDASQHVLTRMNLNCDLFLHLIILEHTICSNDCRNRPFSMIFCSVVDLLFLKLICSAFTKYRYQFFSTIEVCVCLVSFHHMLKYFLSETLLIFPNRLSPTVLAVGLHRFTEILFFFRAFWIQQKKRNLKSHWAIWAKTSGYLRKAIWERLSKSR